MFPEHWVQPTLCAKNRAAHRQWIQRPTRQTPHGDYGLMGEFNQQITMQKIHQENVANTMKGKVEGAMRW